MRRAWLAALAAAAWGCYSPSPPTGAYRCPDNVCPSGQHCTCGLCVYKDSEAACKLTVDASGGGSSAPTVNEHQQFPVNLAALQADGQPATGFNGTVTLSFVLPGGERWCDVSPSTVTLQGGQAANVMVAVNRETIPPQQPHLLASFGAATGQSAGITVLAPALTKDANATVPPVSAQAPFGYATTYLAEADVIFDGSQFRLYFAGGASTASTRSAIGVATSADGGRTFSARTTPVFSAASGTFYTDSVRAPAVFASAAGYSLLFAGSVTPGQTAASAVGLATSADGLAGFAIANGGKPVLDVSQCDYCTYAVDFPSVIDDPSPVGGASDAGGGAKLVFFSATKKDKMGNSGQPSIGRASSPDGMTFTPEPAPVLNGDFGGEALLVSPQVMIDGTVYKMWYSFARLQDFRLGATFCDTRIAIGYATSSDGFYWVRSPGNVGDNPPITTGTSGWDAGTLAFLAGSAVPLDGKDPSSGIALYYTTMHKDALGFCVPNGIGRATRP
jgi:hypothetical protein